MNTILGETNWKYTMDYIDDVNVYSQTWEEHLKHLEKTLERISKAGLKLNKEKYIFATQRVTYLRYIIRIDEIRPDPEKIEKVKNFSQSTNVKEV